MSERLERLYAATQRQGLSFEQRGEVWAAFREYAAQIGEGLPFPYSLRGAVASRLATSIGAIHIVVAEDTHDGGLHRIADNPLCRPFIRFAGGLGDLQPPEHGATCINCLKIAETHSIIEWQTSKEGRALR